MYGNLVYNCTLYSVYPHLQTIELYLEAGLNTTLSTLLV